MAYRALLKKKLSEWNAGRVGWAFAVLFVLSFSVVLARLSWPSATSALLLAPFAIVGFFLGFGCAAMAFGGDYAKDTQRFLEYLPVRRSAIWLVGYIAGLCLLCSSALLLFGTGLFLYEPPSAEVEYFVSGRIALAASGGAALFWMYSIAVFSVAYLDTRKEGATGAGVGGMLLGTGLMPVAVGVLLVQVHTLPPVTALIPVLLPSALLFSAGSYLLFAVLPRHVKRATRAVLGGALFLLLAAILLGHLYVKHFAWRTVDPAEPLVITQVWQPDLKNKSNYVLADVMSYRSGEHCVSIDLAQGAYHDLGRHLKPLGMPDNDRDLLHFVHYRDGGRDRSYFSMAAMDPDGTHARLFRVDAGESFRVQGDAKWLRNPRRLLYPVYCQATQQSFLCVADSAGELLTRFETGNLSNGFLVSPANDVVTLAPQESRTGRNASKPTAEDGKPYMFINVDFGTEFRFDTPGPPLFFAEDLRGVICSRDRIQDGRCYRSYVLLELPSLAERVLLSEDEFPPTDVTSQVERNDAPTLGSFVSHSFMHTTDTFEAAFWVKQRVEGDYFRYSIILINLNTGQRRTVVPESETPRLSVVATEIPSRTSPVILHGSTANGTGFMIEIGEKIHRFELGDEESITVADKRVLLDADHEAPDIHYYTAFSPTGFRVLRHGHIREYPRDDPTDSRWKHDVIDVFIDGVPRRLFCEKQRIARAFWLDENRIAFHTVQAIYSLKVTTGSIKQVFPPKATARVE